MTFDNFLKLRISLCCVLLYDRSYITASGSDGAGNSGNRTDCGIVCINGCCANGGCCEVQSSTTIQVVSMVGSFVILVSVILFCYLRYRCYCKDLHNIVASRQQGRSRPGHSHYLRGGSRPISVSTVQVQSRDNFGASLESFSSRDPHNLFHIILRSEAQPPPYTENDPLAFPSSDRVSAAGLCARASCMDLPPAYSDIVRENEAGGETSGQQRE